MLLPLNEKRILQRYSRFAALFTGPGGFDRKTVSNEAIDTTRRQVTYELPTVDRLVRV
jgi:hypothetical protein